MAEVLRGLTIRILGDPTDIQRKIDIVKKDMEDLAKVGADTSSQQNSLKRLEKQLAGTELTAKNLQRALRGIGRSIKDEIGTEALKVSQNAAKALAGIGAALAAVGAKAVQEAGKFQQIEAAFTNLLGSSEKAGDYIRELQDFAKKTPFTFEDLTVGAQRFMAMGFTAEEVIPTLKAVGDAAAGVGLGAEGINRISLALGQIKAKGTVQAEEFRQLAEAGIPAWDMLAKKMGVDVATAMKQVEKRAVSAQTGIDALVEGINGKYGGMMEQQAKTITGSWAIMTDGVQQSLAQIGLKIDETFDISGTLRGMGTALSDFSRTVQDSGIREALSQLIPPELGALAAAASVALVGLAAVGIKAAIVALGGLAASAAAAVAPFAPIIAAAAALAAGLYYLWQQGVTLAGALDAMNVSTTYTNGLLVTFNQMLDSVGTTASNAWQVMQPFAEFWGTVLKAALIGVVNLLGLVVNGILAFATVAAFEISQILDVANNLYNGITGLLSSLATWIDEKTGGMLTSIKNFVTDAIAWIDKYLGKFTQIKPPDADWMSSGDSDDYDKLSPGFNIYTGEIEKQAPPMPTIGEQKAKGGAEKISEEERAIEALIKKYADASEQARLRGKVALQVSELSASMLIGEAKEREELNNKIAGFTANHEAILDGYQKELELAQKIEEAGTRERTIDGIKAQIAAQDELYKKQVEAANWAANYKNLQKESKTLMDQVFGNPEDVQARIEENKQALEKFMSEVDAIEAGETGSFGSENMGDGTLSKETQGFLKRILTLSPDELQTEFETKQGQFDYFADYIKSKMAEATAAENENLGIGEEWAKKQESWISSIGSSMGDALADWINGAKGIGEAMRDMVSDLIKESTTLLARWLSVFAIMSIIGDPRQAAQAANKMVLGVGDWSWGKKAGGGLIVGAGTGTSDSIPTLLSNGEYVVNAAAVSKLGVPFMNAINSGAFPSLSRFASGGFVGERLTFSGPSIIGGAPDYSRAQNFSRDAANAGGAGETLGAEEKTPVILNVSAMDASSFMDFLSRGALDVIRQALYDTDRNFGTNAGVW